MCDQLATLITSYNTGIIISYQLLREVHQFTDSPTLVGQCSVHLILYQATQK